MQYVCLISMVHMTHGSRSKRPAVGCLTSIVHKTAVAGPNDLPLPCDRQRSDFHRSAVHPTHSRTRLLPHNSELKFPLSCLRPGPTDHSRLTGLMFDHHLPISRSRTAPGEPAVRMMACLQ